MPIAVPVAEIDCRTEGTWMLPDAPATPDPSIPVPGRVPDGFEPVAALRCTPLVPGAEEGVEAEAPVDDTDPTAVVARVERFEGDLDPLVTALAEPDDPVPTDQVCTADLELVAALWLEDADGRLIPVHYPRDACGKTKPAVHDALAGLEVTSVSEVTIIRPGEALHSPSRQGPGVGVHGGRGQFDRGVPELDRDHAGQRMPRADESGRRLVEPPHDAAVTADPPRPHERAAPAALHRDDDTGVAGHAAQRGGDPEPPAAESEAQALDGRSTSVERVGRGVRGGPQHARPLGDDTAVVVAGGGRTAAMRMRSRSSGAMATSVATAEAAASRSPSGTSSPSTPSTMRSAGP